MGINLTNFLSSKSKNKRMMEFQDLDHIDGVSISTVSANLYKDPRDDLVMFYFRDGANYASVYTQSKIISENIKWNLNQKIKKVFSLLVNTRNAAAVFCLRLARRKKICIEYFACCSNAKPPPRTFPHAGVEAAEHKVDVLLFCQETASSLRAESRSDMLSFAIQTLHHI